MSLGSTRQRHECNRWSCSAAGHYNQVNTPTDNNCSDHDITDNLGFFFGNPITGEIDNGWRVDYRWRTIWQIRKNGRIKQPLRWWGQCGDAFVRNRCIFWFMSCFGLGFIFFILSLAFVFIVAPFSFRSRFSKFNPPTIGSFNFLPFSVRISFFLPATVKPLVELFVIESIPFVLLVKTKAIPCVYSIIVSESKQVQSASFADRIP